MVRITLSTGESHDVGLTLAGAMAAVDEGVWMELDGRAVRTAHVVSLEELSPAGEAEDEEVLDLPFGS